MQPSEEGCEVEARDDLAVDDEAPLFDRAQRVDELREVAVERTSVAAAQLHCVAVARGKAAKAVPLGLVEVVADGQLADELCEHGFGHDACCVPAIAGTTRPRTSPSSTPGARPRITTSAPSGRKPWPSSSSDPGCGAEIVPVASRSPGRSRVPFDVRCATS